MRERGIFCDASAVLAILLNESDAEFFADKIRQANKRFTSAVSHYEITVTLCRALRPGNQAIKRETIAEAHEVAEDFFTENAITILSIGAAEARAALKAYQQYGKGTGAKANLNMGDCFSYACAQTRSLPLLFKGNDFTHTAIIRA